MRWQKIKFCFMKQNLAILTGKNCLFFGENNICIFKMMTEGENLLLLKYLLFKIKIIRWYMGQVMRKRVLCHIRTTKAQISLHIHAVWSASLLFAA